METGDKTQITHHLSRFKEKGLVRFDKVLAIESGERIAALVRQDEGYLKVAAAIAASIQSAVNNLNLKLNLSEDQIAELAGLIIDDAEEDNLALEDVLLFLQQMITGKLGKIYERLDIQKFFELFEVYRQQRHENLIRIREEQAAQHKALPIGVHAIDVMKDLKSDNTEK